MKREITITITLDAPDDAFDEMPNETLVRRLHDALRMGFPFLKGDEIGVKQTDAAGYHRVSASLGGHAVSLETCSEALAAGLVSRVIGGLTAETEPELARQRMHSAARAATEIVQKFTEPPSTPEPKNSPSDYCERCKWQRHWHEKPVEKRPAGVCSNFREPE